MPNYAWNTISMKASDYKKYVEGIDEEGNPTVDFNVLIPMPKSYEGNAIKYVCRYRNKNGIKDLKKAEQYWEILIKDSEEAEENERRY